MAKASATDTATSGGLDAMRRDYHLSTFSTFSTNLTVLAMGKTRRYGWGDPRPR
jgi:hypothetical protein